MNQQETAFENIVGKEETALNEQFLLFPQCFLLNQKIVSPYVNIFDIISYLLLNWKSPKLTWGKGLKQHKWWHNCKLKSENNENIMNGDIMCLQDPKQGNWAVP